MRGIYCQAEGLLASQEGLCFVVLAAREENSLKDVTMYVRIILKLIFNVYAVKNCNRVTKEGNLQREREGMS
jgi:uncharacterized integral membrane protein